MNKMYVRYVNNAIRGIANWFTRLGRPENMARRMAKTWSSVVPVPSIGGLTYDSVQAGMWRNPEKPQNGQCSQQS